MYYKYSTTGHVSVPCAVNVGCLCVVVPTAPTSLNVTAEDTVTEMSVSWTKPASGKVYNYLLTYTVTGSDSNITKESKTSPYTLTGLNSNEAYTISVQTKVKYTVVSGTIKNKTSSLLSKEGVTCKYMLCVCVKFFK